MKVISIVTLMLQELIYLTNNLNLKLCMIFTKELQKIIQMDNIQAQDIQKKENSQMNLDFKPTEKFLTWLNNSELDLVNIQVLMILKIIINSYQFIHVIITTMSLQIQLVIFTIKFYYLFMIHQVQKLIIIFTMKLKFKLL